MKDSDDLMRFLLKAVQLVVGEHSLTELQVVQIEERMYSELGGSAIYVQKKDRERRKESVLRDFDGTNRRHVCKKHGISKTQFYRFLKAD